MRVARSADEIEQAWSQAGAEALAAFGDGRLYLEKLIEGGRHIEIQIMADRYGNVVHLGERDCTVQRNHQKLIEESPAPTLDPGERERTLAAAVEATASDRLRRRRHDRVPARPPQARACSASWR